MARTYKKINYQDRKKIEELLKEKKSGREIAKEIGVHYATIYRELERGLVIKANKATYSADAGQKKIFAS